MKKKDNSKDRTKRYRERLTEKQAVAAETADALATIKRLNLSGFSEVGSGVPARTWLEEVQTHRSWLRALQQPEILPGESLKELARRTWQALLTSKGYGVDTDGGGKWVDGQWVPGFDVFYPLFSPSQQHFQVPFDSTRFPGGPFCEAIRDGAKHGWFEVHWVPPADCGNGEADQPIDIASLPALPQRKTPELKKSEPSVLPSATDVPFITGLETPLNEQNKFSDFGSFGLSITGTNPL